MLNRSVVMRAAAAAMLALPIGVATAAQYDGKKILYIDSYHVGYPWSDGISEGVNKTLKGSGVELKIIRMDTKLNKGSDFIAKAVDIARATIDEFKPDVVIASDDNASKYLIMPHYRDADLPFVFCGVNWDASPYGFPYKNVTGMVEVAGAKELVDLLSQFAKGPRVGLLADDTLTSRKDARNYREKLGLELTSRFVNSMEEWKARYTELQSEVDIMIVGNIIGIKDFDSKAAEAHALRNAKIPSGAVQPQPMPYAMVGYLKVAEEQGIWAAEAALRILGGASPSSIPIVRNTEGQVMINAKMVEAIGAELPYSLIETASAIIE